MKSFLRFLSVTALMSFSLVASAQSLDLTVNLDSPPSCPGASDAQVSLDATGGTGSYSYYIVDQVNPPQTIVVNNGSNPVFTGLTPNQTYIFQVDDGVNIQTRQFFIEDTENVTLELTSDLGWYTTKTACPDVYEMQPKFQNQGNNQGFPPYTISVEDAGGGTIYTATNQQPMSVDGGVAAGNPIPGLIYGDDYTLTIRDACGQVDTEDFNLEPFQISVNPILGSCNTVSFYRITVQGMGDLVSTSNIGIGTSTMVTTNNNTGVVIIDTFATGADAISIPGDEIVQGDNYTFEFMDDCGVNLTRNYTIPSLNNYSWQGNVRAQGCLDGTALVFFQNLTSPFSEWEISIISGPTTFTNVDGETRSVTYPQDYTGKGVFSGLPVGTYEFLLNTGCGEADEPYTVTITEADVINTEVAFTAVQACSGVNSLEVEIVDNTSLGAGRGLFVYNSSNQLVWEMNPMGVTGSTYTIPNLPGDTYTYMFDGINGNATTGSCNPSQPGYANVFCPCDKEEEAIELLGYNQPIALNVDAFACASDGTIFIDLTAGGGKPPYLYEILSAPNAADVGASNNDGFFNNLSSQGPYLLRMTDDCGNSSDVSLDVAQYEAELEVQCINNGAIELIASVTNVENATYIFTDPSNNVIQSGPENVLVIDPYTPLQFGEYHLEVQYDNGVLTCELVTATFDLGENSCCDYLPAPAKISCE